MIRDGRDVALSLRPMWFAPGRDMKTLGRYWSRLVRQTREAGRRVHAYHEVRYEDLVADPIGVLQPLCHFLKLEFDPAMLRYWERTPERLREHRTRYGIDGRALITHDRRVEQQRLTQQSPQVERASCWRREMTAQEQSEFALHAGAALQELGYGLTQR